MIDETLRDLRNQVCKSYTIVTRSYDGCSGRMTSETRTEHPEPYIKLTHDQGVALLALINKLESERQVTHESAIDFLRNEAGMTDREKIINELVEHIESALAVDGDYVDCVRTDLLQTVVGLLKEQEAVKPVLDEQTGRLWLCGKCGSYVGFEDNDPHDPNEFDKFCRECGRPVLWEGR